MTRPIMPMKVTLQYSTFILDNLRLLSISGNHSFKDFLFRIGVKFNIVVLFDRVVSLSWVGFLAQAGGLIGACLGFSFISLIEIIYWFIIRFCRLSKHEKKMEEIARRQSSINKSFDSIWDEVDIHNDEVWKLRTSS